MLPDPVHHATLLQQFCFAFKLVPGNQCGMKLNLRALPHASIAFFLCCQLLAIFAGTASELPLLHPLFSDHAVLQRGVKVPVWGWAKPGSRINVRFGQQEKTATAAPNGKWLVKLSALKASE